MAASKFFSELNCALLRGPCDKALHFVHPSPCARKRSKDIRFWAPGLPRNRRCARPRISSVCEGTFGDSSTASWMLSSQAPDCVLDAAREQRAGFNTAKVHWYNPNWNSHTRVYHQRWFFRSFSAGCFPVFQITRGFTWCQLRISCFAGRARDDKRGEKNLDARRLDAFLAASCSLSPCFRDNIVNFAYTEGDQSLGTDQEAAMQSLATTPSTQHYSLERAAKVLQERSFDTASNSNISVLLNLLSPVCSRTSSLNTSHARCGDALSASEHSFSVYKVNAHSSTNISEVLGFKGGTELERRLPVKSLLHDVYDWLPLHYLRQMLPLTWEDDTRGGEGKKRPLLCNKVRNDKKDRKRAYPQRGFWKKQHFLHINNEKTRLAFAVQGVDLLKLKSLAWGEVQKRRQG